MKKLKKLFIVIDIILIIVAFDIFLIKKDDEEEKAITIPDSPTLLSSVNSGFYIDTNSHKYSDSDIEELIINKDESQSIYKLIETKIDDYPTHIIVVYDPNNVRLITCKGFHTPNNSGKENIVEMTARNGALAGINGGGYVDEGAITYDIPVGYVIKDGQILWGNAERKGNFIGFTNDNKLTLISGTGEEALAQGMRDAVEFGPFLIVNNEITNEANNMASKRASRAVIAQRADGIVILLVTDGGSLVGPRMSEIVNTLRQYGAINAANLDGGASSQMVVNGQLLSVARYIRGDIAVGGRKVVNGWGVFDLSNN